MYSWFHPTHNVQDGDFVDKNLDSEAYQVKFHFLYIVAMRLTVYMQEDKLEDHVKKMIELRIQLDVHVKSNVKVAQERQKKHYDRRHQGGSYEVGQKVLVKNMKKLSKKGDKMAPNWFGPYEVAECVGTNTYHLKKKRGNGCLKVAYSSTRLKLFNERGKINLAMISFLTRILSTEEPELGSSPTKGDAGLLDENDPTPSETIEDRLPTETLPLFYSCSHEVILHIPLKVLTAQILQELVDTLVDQLTDENLLRLLKTGGQFQGHDAESDDFTEVST